MKKHAQLHCLILMAVFCISCAGQNKTEFPRETINSSFSGLSVANVPNTITRTIKQDRKGNIWFASWQGIIRYDGASFVNITKEESRSRFFSVLEDRKGNFWFASIGEGVYYYDGVTFQNYTSKDGLANDRVTNIYEDEKGNIWFGTEGGISYYDGESFQNFTTNEGMPNGDVNAVIEDNTGKFWIGTRGKACFYDGKEFAIIKNNDGTSFTNVRSIIRDKTGDMWFGGNDGLWRYDGDRFIQYTKEFVGYIYEDRSGNIWTSSQSNDGQGWMLSRYDVLTLFNEEVTATQVKTQGGMFFGILEDSDENIWFGTLDGVYRYNGTSFNDFK